MPLLASSSTTTTPTTLQPVPPAGRAPLGRAYRAHGGCVISRSGWDYRHANCVVYGKGGHGAEGHGHHDAGQLCIDAAGERLIVDLGSPSNYPPDFFGPNRYQYYNAAAAGHNILVCGGREMRTGTEHQAVLRQAEFDDARGGAWQWDLTALYRGATKVRRSVIHLLPGVVAVLDEAELPRREEIALRWHTRLPCTPEDDGRFMVLGDHLEMCGLIELLDFGMLSLRSGEHQYSKPFDKGRLGEPLAARFENYVEARVVANAARILTLFCCGEPGWTPDHWRPAGDGWEVQTMEGPASASVSATELRLAGPTGEWRLALPGA